MCENWPIFEVFGSPNQVQTCYGHGGWCMLKRTPNYICYQEVGLFGDDLGYLVQGFKALANQGALMHDL